MIIDAETAKPVGWWKPPGNSMIDQHLENPEKNLIMRYPKQKIPRYGAISFRTEALLRSVPPSSHLRNMFVASALAFTFALVKQR
uniref:Uncharacterized protein n=1 Tax=Setaria digitata TaxID=48799 RepID=A0A915PKQ3_9BILA